MRHRVLATLIHEVEVDRGYHIDAHHCAHAARTASNKTVSGFDLGSTQVDGLTEDLTSCYTGWRHTKLVFREKN